MESRRRSKQLQELCVGVVPGRRVARLVFIDGEASADDFARLADRGDIARGDRLHHDVADGGGFHRAGYHASAAGVGRGLAEQLVLRSPADHVDRFDAAAVAALFAESAPENLH